ncbi:MAG TPA: thrombospondin type 3 repeat-containing protein [Phycisphaerae bacterium]|nr:thrombospondin type 3 repeat-containing protein [Phycisphaerae bacterium]HNU46892.1 thrombospondin type 3 repeat-containing protein [Phycisphaerae bacterium]
MTKSRLIWGMCVLGVSLGYGTSGALADELAFAIEWMVDDVFFDEAGWGISVGDVFQGSFTYDPTVPDADPDPNTGQYPGALLSMVIEAGAHTLVSGGGTIRIRNDELPQGWDEFVIIADSYTTLDGIFVVDQELILRDTTGQVFASDALPTTLGLNLEDFDWTSLYLYGWDYSTGGEFEITGHLTSLSFPDCNGNGIPDYLEADTDEDGVIDDCDNCPEVWNPGQEDCDEDGMGDACEVDADGDAVPDDCDNCPGVFNPGQEDCGGDGIGDACAVDSDGDGVPDDCDNCVDVWNPEQDDCDEDGMGDACEVDSDGDSVPDDCDLCPGFDDLLDTDGDGIPDDCEAAAVGWVYWTDPSRGNVQRADLPDGSSVTDVVTGLPRPYDLAFDVAGGMMYWTDIWTNSIHRANLDGSGVEDLVTGAPGPLGIALDVAGGKMYWTDRTVQRIQRANLDGSGIEDLVMLTWPDYPRLIALDVAGGKMYWTQFNLTTALAWIRRANLEIPEGESPDNRTDVEDLVMEPFPPFEPFAIALDVAGGKMYWTNTWHWPGGQEHIRRANLEIPCGETPDNRTDIEDLVAVDADIEALALDLADGRMYWTQRVYLGEDSIIGRARLDGAFIEYLAPTGASRPAQIALLLPGSDFDGDGDVDLQDFGHFQTCFTGAGLGTPSPGCRFFDADVDDDVDLDDFGAWAPRMAGPSE